MRCDRGAGLAWGLFPDDNHPLPPRGRVHLSVACNTSFSRDTPPRPRTTGRHHHWGLRRTGNRETELTPKVWGAGMTIGHLHGGESLEHVPDTCGNTCLRQTTRSRLCNASSRTLVYRRPSIVIPHHVIACLWHTAGGWELVGLGAAQPCHRLTAQGETPTRYDVSPAWSAPTGQLGPVVGLVCIQAPTSRS